MNDLHAVEHDAANLYVLKSRNFNDAWLVSADSVQDAMDKLRVADGISFSHTDVYIVSEETYLGACRLNDPVRTLVREGDNNA
jgi:hypothetical protein